MTATIASHLGIKAWTNKVYTNPKTGFEVWSFTVGGKVNLKLFLDWLYCDATIYLPRKYEKYQEFLAANAA